MKTAIKGAVLALLVASPGLATAEASKAIGVDVVRWLNPVQDEMQNVFYQHQIGRTLDVYAGYAESTRWENHAADDYTIIDVGLKAYRAQTRDGLFWLVGAAYYDDDYSADDAQTGLAFGVGHEYRLARNIAISTAIKGISGIPHSRGTDTDELFFEPSLSLMITF
ncbi:MAG: hypothetical protein ACQERR_02930 [Pseudomonadota bacterium]